MRQPSTKPSHYITANRGWRSEAMTRWKAQEYAKTLRTLGNVNVRVRRIG